MATRETENNAYAKFWGDKLRALWYVMVFSGVVNYWWTASNWDNRRAGKLKTNKGMYIWMVHYCEQNRTSVYLTNTWVLGVLHGVGLRVFISPSCMLNEQWIFHDNSSVFGQIAKIFDWIELFQRRSYMKFKKTVQKCLECEFTAHYVCRSLE